MRRAVSTVLVAVVVLAMSAAAWADCVGEHSESHARMKCCATAHHKCGKHSTPDDCCKKMQDAGPAAMVATVAVPVIKVPVVHGIVETLSALDATALSGGVTVVAPDFKRPHDPPHLHSFSLLI